VLWSLIVYATLQGSAWLSQIDGSNENPALQFNPFTASVETLKRLLAGNESWIERLLAGPNDVLAPAVQTEPTQKLSTEGGENRPALLTALMRVFTNGLSDDRIEKAVEVLANNQLTANDKLTKIDALMPFPASASAAQLGKLVGVKKQAVLKGEWWIQNRKGEKESEIGRRRAKHQERAKCQEPPRPNDDEVKR
jgi:hypothetical protein